MNIPNIITLGRLLAVPAVIYALSHEHMIVALILFTLAGISDAVDGAIARLFDQRTELGAWLDPLADKALMVSVFVMLAWLNAIPDWLVFLAVTRDILIIGAVLISDLTGNPLKVSPIFISKATTAAQIVFAFLALINLAFNAGLQTPLWFMLYVTAGLTIASGLSYLVVWMRHLAGSE